MGIISVFLLVVFVLVCILIIALVLLQTEDGGGLGGLFAGGSNSAFGSRSASVLTKATYVMVTLFFVTAFLLAFINKSPSDKGVEAAALLEQGGTAAEWWNDENSADVTAESAAEADAAAELPAETVPVDASASSNQ